MLWRFHWRHEYINPPFHLSEFYLSAYLPRILLKISPHHVVAFLVQIDIVTYDTCVSFLLMYVDYTFITTLSLDE